MPLDLAFHFDVKGALPGSGTGQIRVDVAEMVETLCADIPGLRVAAIFHNDFTEPRSIQTRDFGTPAAEVTSVITMTPIMLGETSLQIQSFEQVLQLALTSLTWRSDSRRALVLICESLPDPISSWLGTPEAVGLVRQLGASVYCVQCRHKDQPAEFIQSLADPMGILLLPLARFQSVRQFLGAMPHWSRCTDVLQCTYGETPVPAPYSQVRNYVRAPQPAFNGLVSRFTLPASTAPSKASSPRRTTQVPAAAAAARKSRRKASQVAAALLTGTRSRRTKTRQTKTVGVVGGLGGKIRPAKNRRTSLIWSPWRLIARPGGGVDLSRSSWQRFGTGSARRSLLVSAAGQVAVELAVQLHQGARRLPVFGRVLRIGGDRRRSSVTFGQLLAGVRPSVRAQLLRVLHQGMLVHARVAAVDTAAALAGLMKPQNYAWNSGRSVRRSGVFVSVSEKSLRKFTDGGCKA